MERISKTIDEVLIELDSIIENCIRENNILGVFAYLYRRTTFEVKTAIEKGEFEDNERMELFDVTFANLYLRAFYEYKEDAQICLSWKNSFDARKNNLTILQYLLMGMNAHINYDLGIAASAVMEGKPMKDLESDFNRVNDILARLIDEMQKRISRVSYLMFVIDWIGGRMDEKLININMVKSRHNSWDIANELYGLSEQERIEREKQVDALVSATGELIKNPPSRILKVSFRLVKLFERRNVGIIIARLRS